mgnify:CR=1 FL=1
MLGIYCRTSKARKEKYTIENQKDNEIQKDSNGLKINESNLDETTNKSIVPVKNPVRINEIVTSVEPNVSKTKNQISSKKSTFLFLFASDKVLRYGI